MRPQHCFYVPFTVYILHVKPGNKYVLNGKCYDTCIHKDIISTYQPRYHRPTCGTDFQRKLWLFEPAHDLDLLPSGANLPKKA